MLRMAAAEAIKRMETRATAAEQMIQLLRGQIAEVRRAAAASTFEGEVEALRKENEDLRKQIQAQKERLTQAEVANGGVAPSVSTAITRSVESVPVNNGVAAAEVRVKEEPKSEEKRPEQPAVKKETPAKQEGKGGKKGKKNKEGGGGGDKKPAAAQEELPVHVGRLDMRVGLIRSAKKHPDADALYVEEVDVGEEKPRTVISGLVKFIPLEEMQNRPAILLCNLKPSKMRGIMSEAMVMCASTPEKVELISPPGGSKPGDPVEVPGFARAPDAQLNPKKKIFEACAPDLRVNSSGEATYKGVPWTVNGQKCKSPSLLEVQIK